MLRPFAVDRTLMCDTERARLAAPDLMSTHFDLQPAIAACRTGSAGSQGLLVQNEKAADEFRRDVRRIGLRTQERAGRDSAQQWKFASRGTRQAVRHSFALTSREA
jgi:hypothetical protein